MRAPVPHAILVAFALLGAAPRLAGAQRLASTNVGVAARAPVPTTLPRGDLLNTAVPVPAAERPPGCRLRDTGRRMLLLGAIGAGEGAMLGWMAFAVSIGALSDDHGTEYHRTRRQFVRGGAVIGATIGALFGFGDPPRCRPTEGPDGSGG